MELFDTMTTPREAFFSETLHTIAINTRETEFGSIVEPIPIMLKTYQSFQPNGQSINGFGHPHPVIASLTSVPLAQMVENSSSSPSQPSPIKAEAKEKQTIVRPPKKKWIKEYLGKLNNNSS